MKFSMYQRERAEKFPPEQLREYDREELVRLLLSYGKRPYQVYGTDNGIVFVFVHAEIRDLLEKRAGNEPLTGEWNMFEKGVEQWKDMVVAWKSERAARRTNGVPQSALND